METTQVISVFVIYYVCVYIGASVVMLRHTPEKECVAVLFSALFYPLVMPFLMFGNVGQKVAHWIYRAVNAVK